MGERGGCKFRAHIVLNKDDSCMNVTCAYDEQLKWNGWFATDVLDWAIQGFYSAINRKGFPESIIAFRCSFNSPWTILIWYSQLFSLRWLVDEILIWINWFHLTTSYLMTWYFEFEQYFNRLINKMK